MIGIVHHGDAATVLQEHIAPGSIDMVYADPPFGNGQVWTGKAGRFSDKWTWSRASAEGWDALARHNEAGATVLGAASPEAPLRAYLGVMAGIVLGCHRALSPTGTLWLHFDDTAGAHLRILGDAVFGPGAALGTIVWRRMAGSKSNARSFGRVHDTIAVWARSRAAPWRLWRCDSDLVTGDPLDPANPVRVGGYLDDKLISGSRERVGYPTQKPVALIERLVQAATAPGHVVLDPTSGSGTTLVAAQRLHRQAIGIDASAEAVAVARRRIGAEPPLASDMPARRVA